ncbi:MAG: TolC family protein [Methylobacillus sp.]|nr:TolC family protein [Methylobacillus sp.]
MVALCLLAGCARQVYQADPIHPEQSADAFEARRLDAPELRSYMESQGYAAEAFPLRQWDLRALTLAAFHYNPKLAVAWAEWRVARAREITAGQKTPPSVSGVAEHHSDTGGGISPWSLGVGITIPIETNGKRQARIDEATHLSESAQLAVGQQAWEIRAEVRAALAECRAALWKRQLLEREIALQSAVVEMLQKRRDGGLVSDIDLANARLQWQRLKNTQTAETAHLDELLARLAGVIGVPAAELRGVALDVALPLPENGELKNGTMQRAALLNRLDIRAALARYDAAEARLRLEIARQVPDIALTPGYMFDQGDNVWSLGFSMLLNFVNANRNQGPIAEAEAQRKVAARQFEALQMRVIGEQQSAFALYQSRLVEVEKADAVLESQRQNAARGERQFNAGYIDRLEWTTAQMEALIAEQGRLDAVIRAEQALAALENALQYPLDGGECADGVEPPSSAPCFATAESNPSGTRP